MIPLAIPPGLMSTLAPAVLTGFLIYSSALCKLFRVFDQTGHVPLNLGLGLSSFACTRSAKAWSADDMVPVAAGLIATCVVGTLGFVGSDGPFTVL